MLALILIILQISISVTNAALNTSCATTYYGYWSLQSQSCFMLLPPPVNQTNQWSQAVSRCNAYTKLNNGLFSRMGHIYNSSVWTNLKKWIITNGNMSADGAWFGLYRASGPATQIGISDWRWINNLGGFQKSLTLAILNDISVSMNYSSSEICVKIVNGNLWQPVLCNQTLPYFCELYEVTLTSYQACPQEWIQINQACYMPLYSFPGTWLTAQSSCASVGGNLPIFFNSKDWTSFNSYRSSLLLQNDRIWIGGNYTLLSLGYSTVKGKPLTTTFWAKNYPSLTFPPQCIISYETGNPTYGWQNKACSLSSTFTICQIQCDLPYVLSYGLCVQDPSQRGDFLSASNTCLKNNATLPVFHNTLQWAGFFLYMLTNNFLSDFWVGSTNMYAPNYWSNIDFSKFDWSLWTIGYPKLTGNCAAAKFLSQLMFNDNCSNQYSIICMYNPPVTWTTCPATNDSYLYSWQKSPYNNVCYRYIPENSITDFDSAMQVCYSMDGKLATMYSGATDYWDVMRYAGILNVTNNMVANNVWLGTTQQMEFGSWQNLEGTLTNSWTTNYWVTGSNAAQSSNFVFANALQNSLWQSDVRSSKHHVICEYRINFSPSIDKTLCMNNLTFPTYYKTKQVAISGAQCLPWNTSTVATSYLPENYCRNAFLNSQTGPWCFTSPNIPEDCFYRCPCASLPCLNSGLCVANGQNYTCQCSSNFYGTNCEYAATTSTTSTKTTFSTTTISKSTLPTSLNTTIKPTTTSPKVSTTLSYNPTTINFTEIFLKATTAAQNNVVLKNNGINQANFAGETTDHNTTSVSSLAFGTTTITQNLSTTIESTSFESSSTILTMLPSSTAHETTVGSLNTYESSQLLSTSVDATSSLIFSTSLWSTPRPSTYSATSDKAVISNITTEAYSLSSSLLLETSTPTSASLLTSNTLSESISESTAHAIESSSSLISTNEITTLTPQFSSDMLTISHTAYLSSSVHNMPTTSIDLTTTSTNKENLNSTIAKATTLETDMVTSTSLKWEPTESQSVQPTVSNVSLNTTIFLAVLLSNATTTLSMNSHPSTSLHILTSPQVSDSLTSFDARTTQTPTDLPMIEPTLSSAINGKTTSVTPPTIGVVLTTNLNMESSATTTISNTSLTTLGMTSLPLITSSEQFLTSNAYDTSLSITKTEANIISTNTTDSQSTLLSTTSIETAMTVLDSAVQTFPLSSTKILTNSTQALSTMTQFANAFPIDILTATGQATTNRLSTQTSAVIPTTLFTNLTASILSTVNQFTTASPSTTNVLTAIEQAITSPLSAQISSEQTTSIDTSLVNQFTTAIPVIPDILTTTEQVITDELTTQTYSLQTTNLFANSTTESLTVNQVTTTIPIITDILTTVAQTITSGLTTQKPSLETTNLFANSTTNSLPVNQVTTTIPIITDILTTMAPDKTSGLTTQATSVQTTNLFANSAINSLLVNQVTTTIPIITDILTTIAQDKTSGLTTQATSVQTTNLFANSTINSLLVKQVTTSFPMITDILTTQELDKTSGLTTQAASVQTTNLFANSTINSLLVNQVTTSIPIITEILTTMEQDKTSELTTQATSVQTTNLFANSTINSLLVKQVTTSFPMITYILATKELDKTSGQTTQATSVQTTNLFANSTINSLLVNQVTTSFPMITDILTTKEQDKTSGLTTQNISVETTNLFANSTINSISVNQVTTSIPVITDILTTVEQDKTSGLTTQNISVETTNLFANSTINSISVNQVTTSIPVITDILTTVEQDKTSGLTIKKISVETTNLFANSTINSISMNQVTTSIPVITDILTTVQQAITDEGTTQKSMPTTGLFANLTTEILSPSEITTTFSLITDILTTSEQGLTSGLTSQAMQTNGASLSTLSLSPVSTSIISSTTEIQNTVSKSGSSVNITNPNPTLIFPLTTLQFATQNILFSTSPLQTASTELSSTEQKLHSLSTKQLENATVKSILYTTISPIVTEISAVTKKATTVRLMLQRESTKTSVAKEINNISTISSLVTKQSLSASTVPIHETTEQIKSSLLTATDTSSEKTGYTSLTNHSTKQVDTTSSLNVSGLDASSVSPISLTSTKDMLSLKSSSISTTTMSSIANNISDNYFGSSISPFMNISSLGTKTTTMVAGHSTLNRIANAEKLTSQMKKHTTKSVTPNLISTSLVINDSSSSSTALSSNLTNIGSTTKFINITSTTMHKTTLVNAKPQEKPTTKVIHTYSPSSSDSSTKRVHNLSTAGPLISISPNQISNNFTSKVAYRNVSISPRTKKTSKSTTLTSTSKNVYMTTNSKFKEITKPVKQQQTETSQSTESKSTSKSIALEIKMTTLGASSPSKNTSTAMRTLHGSTEKSTILPRPSSARNLQKTSRSDISGKVSFTYLVNGDTSATSAQGSMSTVISNRPGKPTVPSFFKTDISINATTSNPLTNYASSLKSMSQNLSTIHTNTTSRPTVGNIINVSTRFQSSAFSKLIPHSVNATTVFAESNKFTSSSPLFEKTSISTRNELNGTELNWHASTQNHAKIIKSSTTSINVIATTPKNIVTSTKMPTKYLHVSTLVSTKLSKSTREAPFKSILSNVSTKDSRVTTFEFETQGNHIYSSVLFSTKKKRFSTKSVQNIVSLMPNDLPKPTRRQFVARTVQTTIAPILFALQNAHLEDNISNHTSLRNSQNTTSTPRSANSTDRTPYHEMDDTEWIVSVAFQTMGCTYIIGCLTATLALFAMFKNMTIEKVIVVNEEVALLIAHILILTVREPRMYPGMSTTLCTLVAIALQYFFTSAYAFMFLEALQCMVIVGRVKFYGPLMPWYINMAIGWGAPILITAISTPFINNHVTRWTCWGDMQNEFNWAVFVPMGIFCAVTAIIVESAGMIGRDDSEEIENMSEPTQFLSAQVSQRGLPIVVSLTVSSHVMGMTAVYFQIVYLYVVCFFLNIFCGFAIFTFHTAIDSKIRAFVCLTIDKIKTMLCYFRRK